MGKHKVMTGVFAGMILAAGMALAADKPAPTGAKAESKAIAAPAGMGHKKCDGVCDSLDKVIKTVQDARKSDDKAKMKAGLEAAESQLTLMKKHHMEQCERMMGKGGEGMETGDGGMQCHREGHDEAAPASGAPKKGEGDEHEKHHH